MTLAIQGGSGGPDLGITENASIGRLNELDGLMDLTPKLQPYLADLNEFAVKEGSKDGKNYCVPWDIGPVVTFYRRDIFKAAGLSDKPEDVSEMVSTWDKYLQTCQTIKDKTGLPCFAMNKANNYGDTFFNMTWQQGLDLYKDGTVLVDQPQYAEALNKMGQFWEADLVSDNLEWTDNWYAEMNAKIDDPNVKPVASVVIAAWMGNFLKTWISADQAGNWGVALMPAYTEGGVRSANQGGSCAFVPASSTNPDAAWAFIEFMLLRKENQVKIFEYSDYFPAYEVTYDDPLFNKPDEYFGGQVTRTVFADVARQIPIANQYGPLSQTVRGAVATAIQTYAMGQMSAEDALKEAADAIRTETGMK
jgi:ABC-type glycerol-3-phosphate transport system substrate-binding protein